MPPPKAGDEFPEMVTFESVAVPLFSMPPPKLAEFPEM